MIRSPTFTFKGLFPDYGIDEFGNVYSMKSGKKLTWHINEHGYASIALRRDKKNYYFKIHRLVMLNHHSLGIGKLDVNHKDGNKLNNHVSNLEWATRSKNLQHAYDTGLKVAKPRYGKNNPNSKFSKKVVMRIIHRIFIDKWDDESIANENGCSKSYVSHIRNGRIRKKDVKQFKKLHLIK